MHLSLLLALRFLKSSAQEKTISVMIKICFLSILVGTCALTLVAAIMRGFEQATSRKLQGIHADLTINAHDKAIKYAKLKKVLMDEFADTIEAISPTSMHHVIIHNKRNEQKEFALCLLKAINPEEEQKVTTLSSMIKTANNDPWPLLKNNTIFIGQALAEQLHCIVGDSLILYYPENTKITHRVVLEEKKVTVGALFKTGIQDFDEHVIIASCDFARSLYPTAVSQVSIKLKDSCKQARGHEAVVIESLKKRLGLEVISWKELYPSLVSALTLEKYAMLFILALVALVASLNIMALLFMYTTQKRTDIAILKSMGMSDLSLMSIFMLVSGFITSAATFCGLLIAALIVYILNRYPFIELPDVYYVSHLPASLEPSMVFAVSALALLVSLAAGYIPARKIKSMAVARILKSMA